MSNSKKLNYHQHLQSEIAKNKFKIRSLRFELQAHEQNIVKLKLEQATIDQELVKLISQKLGRSVSIEEAIAYADGLRFGQLHQDEHNT